MVGASKEKNKHTHACAQCSLARVGLTQALPNKLVFLQNTEGTEILLLASCFECANSTVVYLACKCMVTYHIYLQASMLQARTICITGYRIVGNFHKAQVFTVLAIKH